MKKPPRVYTLTIRGRHVRYVLNEAGEHFINAAALDPFFIELGTSVAEARAALLAEIADTISQRTHDDDDTW